MNASEARHHQQANDDRTHQYSPMRSTAKARRLLRRLDRRPCDRLAPSAALFGGRRLGKASAPSVPAWSLPAAARVPPVLRSALCCVSARPGLGSATRLSLGRRAGGRRRARRPSRPASCGAGVRRRRRSGRLFRRDQPQAVRFVLCDLRAAAAPRSTPRSGARPRPSLRSSKSPRCQPAPECAARCRRAGD